MVGVISNSLLGIMLGISVTRWIHILNHEEKRGENNAKNRPEKTRLVNTFLLGAISGISFVSILVSILRFV